jgi:hypothetical protein
MNYYYQVWFFIKKNHKCEIYIESKLTKLSFQTIKINCEPLNLITKISVI